MSNEQTIVYGEVRERGELVLIPHEQALRLVALRQALHDSATWGEFKRKLPFETYTAVLKRLDHLPTEQEVFDPSVIRGFNDGYWPSHTGQAMLAWLPDEIEKEYGVLGSIGGADGILSFKIQDQEAIIEALESHGYLCMKDDLLVFQASGYLNS